MSDPSAEAQLAKLGGDLLVALIRGLRIAAVHDLKNEAARQVIEDWVQVLGRSLSEASSLQLQCVGDAVYFNHEFVRLKTGATFDASIQARRLYRRLGINEIAISAAPDAAEVEAFLLAFQRAILSQDSTVFAKERFSKFTVRPIADSPSFHLDRKLELARTYAQLVVVLEEALAAVADVRLVALSRVRRAVQQLAASSEGQASLLGGLTRLANPEAGLPMHGAAVTALVLLMGQRLSPTRGDLMGLLMSAVFHDLGRAWAGPEREPPALSSALAIASFHQPREGIERCSVALEVPLPASGGELGLLPGLSAQLVSIASAYDRLVHPGSGRRGLKPDQAVRLLVDHGGQRFDRRVAKLFQSVLGLYPVGSVVRLSGGQRAVVVAPASDPLGAARPTVKVLDGPGPGYLVELSAPGETLTIVETLDPEAAGGSITALLLA